MCTNKLCSLAFIAFITCAGILFTGFSFTENFTGNDFDDGWTDLIEQRDNILTENASDQKKITNAFSKSVVGKSIKLVGYLKQVGPHFAEDRDYYFTKEVEDSCLPYFKNDYFCGKSNETYVRVIFNGTGYTERDFDILINPNKNKFLRTNDELKEKVIDDGNYKIFTYGKKFNLEAQIVDAHITCGDGADCENGLITVHIDQWRFRKDKKKKKR